MTETKDIDTAVVTAAEITSTKGLSDAIFEMAALQLAVNKAATEEQTKIEETKKIFEEGTRAARERLASLLAGVEKFAKANRTLLFPGKAKTFKVLEHALKYRVSSSLKHDSVTALIEGVKAALAAKPTPTPEQQAMLLGLLRQPPLEINKDAAKAAWVKHEEQLKSLGFTLETGESFKVEFNFSPTQES